MGSESCYKAQVGLEYLALLPLQSPAAEVIGIYTTMRIATYIYTYIHMYKTGFHYTALVGLELPMKIKLASNLQSCL